jgi:Rieske Fe-S protein
VFKGFSAKCTHAGCTVNKVADGTIDCPCHGSKFAVADGSVVHGPAQRPLASRQITVSGDEVLLQA